MKKINNLLVVMFFFVTATIFAQIKVNGTVVDETGEPLPGASVVEQGTKKGTATDFDGNFTLTTQSNKGTLMISFVGYANKVVSFQSANVGKIQLTPNTNSLDEVVIIGKGVIDLAGGRKTPVAVSTIKAEEIQKKIGTQDVTATLVYTPSVYVAGQAGGFGDSRIAVRGFAQDNTAYLLNGQPINGMEDGKMYWSNWSGINDIAAAIQIQRGLGASKLAISSVGGTTNFVVKTTDKKQGGYIKGSVANNAFFKTTAFYNTGRADNGLAASVMFSHWQGDGYSDGNKGQGQTYFVSFGYKVNEKHNLNFLITGAPQWHDNNFRKKISTLLEKGKRYNNNWGTYKGEYMTERRNFYHKPVANLNWDFNINETSNLSTVLYASWGRGGGTGGRGKRIRTKDGLVDYDAIYAKNAEIAEGKGGYYAAGGGYATRASMNLHSWYGLVTNFEKVLNENITFNIGADLRTYYGEHFRVIKDFHGLKSWQENIRLRDQSKSGHPTYGSYGTYKNVIATKSWEANPYEATFSSFDRDQKIAYNNDERISYLGAFTQLEYANDNFSAFFQGAVSNQKHQRFDHYQYANQSLIDGSNPQGTGESLPSGITDGVNSEKVQNFGYNVKGGLSYIIQENHKVFFNTGYYSRQPYHDNIYLNYSNYVNPATENEKIFGLEAGYSFKSSNFSGNLNLYRTSWKDRVVTSSKVVDDVVQLSTNRGVEQLHQGVEYDFIYKPIDNLKVKGFGSFGDWKYKGKGITQVTDEELNILSTKETDFDGGEVGDAAQTTVGFGVDYTIVNGLSVDADFRYYDRLYADVGAIKENLKLPSFNLVDMGVSYNLPLGSGKQSLGFRVNVNNVFNKEYISESSTAIKADDLIDSKDASKGTYKSAKKLYKGVATDNQVHFGWGTTWNASVRFKF